MTRSFLLAILGSPKVSEIVLPLLEMRRQKLEQLFAIGQRRGEIRRDWKAADLARVSQELAFGTSLFWSLKTVAPLDQLLDENFRLFLSNRDAEGSRSTGGRFSPSSAVRFQNRKTRALRSRPGRRA